MRWLIEGLRLRLFYFLTGIKIRLNYISSEGKMPYLVLLLVVIPLFMLVVAASLGHNKQVVESNTGNSSPLNSSVQTPVPQSDAQQTPSDIVYYPVERVVDGDTIMVTVEGVSERVRFIGVDTPETVDPRKPVQCYGVEASNYVKSLLGGKKVGLESDSSQGNRDKYKRLLRYIFLPDGTNVDEDIIAKGYGHEYTYDAPYKYQSQFKHAELVAQENKMGLWASNTCNGITN